MRGLRTQGGLAPAFAGLFPGVCRTTSINASNENWDSTRCARISDHGAVKDSNAPGNIFLPGIPTESRVNLYRYVPPRLTFDSPP
jgi:hypothetical protein